MTKCFRFTFSGRQLHHSKILLKDCPVDDPHVSEELALAPLEAAMQPKLIASSLIKQSKKRVVIIRIGKKKVDGWAV